MGIRVLFCHNTAFEYWRLANHAMPQKTNATMAPRPVSIDSEIMRAAKIGGTSLPLHCLVNKKRHKQLNVTYHFASRALPRGAVYEIADGIGVVSPELALMQIAPLVSVPELAGLMTEFCGYYSPADFEHYGLVKRRPLTTVSSLKAFAGRMQHTKGLDKFQQAVQYAFDRSRSPMETGLALLLALPPRYGGYALGGLELNKQICLKDADRRAFGVAMLCPDICWEQERLCVEYDSVDFHANTARVVNDAQRKNAFAAAGYIVNTFTKTQLRSWDKTDLFAEQLAKHLGKRIRGRGKEMRPALRKQLFSSRSVLKNQYEVSNRMGQGVIKWGAPA